MNETNHDFDGKYPIAGLKINLHYQRTAKEKVEVFHKFFVPDIADLVGPLYSMDATLRPGYKPMKRMVGTAFTVKIPPGDNLMLIKALTLAEPGDILVVDARGHAAHCCGGAGHTVISKRRGILGMVVDGAYRDMSEIEALDFPIFCKGIHPATGPKRGPGEIGVPVSCGGVVVHPGDVIIGDEDGLCCVPQQYVNSVIENCKVEPVKEKEEDWPDVVEKNKARDAYYNQVLAARNVEIINKQ